MHYSNELVAREIEQCPCPVQRVLDLGCGVGGSLFYLGRRLPGVRCFTGISLSPLQINSARQRIPETRKSRFHFEEGCFLQLPAERFKTDFSYSIEAFAHGPDPDAFFGVQAGVLPPGGRLAIIDDCLSDEMNTEGLPARQAAAGHLPPELAVAGFAGPYRSEIPRGQKRASASSRIKT